MKKSLFGKNIPVNCSYCEYNGIENDIMFCKKSKQVKDLSLIHISEPTRP